MPYYLAPYEKVSAPGRERCEPVGCDGLVRGPIDLRPDGGATLDGGGLNACLLWLPRRTRDWRLTMLAEAAEEPLAVATRRLLQSRLWLADLPMGTFAAAILRMLLVPPDGGWPALSPTQDGVYEVWLGGARIEAQRAIRGGATITESFNKADGALGPDLTWTIFDGSGLSVISNQASRSGSGEGMARADSDLASANHYAQAIAGASYVTTDAYIGVLCRKDATATVTCYRWSNFGSVGDWELVKFVSGVETALDTAYTTDPAATESFKIEANGSTIRGFHTAGTQRASVTDSAITGNVRCGIHIGGSANANIDSFEAGDLAAAGGISVPVVSYYTSQRRR